MCLLRLCCDPHKLTYIAAIFTACEAVIFGFLNFILIMVATCVIKPTENTLSAGLDKFYSWYYYTPNGSCTERYGPNFTVPDWVKNDYPLPVRPEETLPETNLAYQIAYLILHALWFISALLLMYGNARKRWGYYLPWLIISLTITFMDVAIGAFFIIDMMDVFQKNRTGTSIEEIQPMIWSFSMYLRAYVIWFMNFGHLATGLNAFCKTYHKRSKEKRKREKLQRKHEKELAMARISAAAEVRPTTYKEEQTQITQAPHNNYFPPEPTIQHEGVQEREGVQNDEYEVPPRSETPPYVEPHHPQPKAPTEVRPFSYLNPGFRPTDSHDVIGMKTHPPPELPESNRNRKEPSYFSAVPPTYNDDISSEGITYDSFNVDRIMQNQNCGHTQKKCIPAKGQMMDSSSKNIKILQREYKKKIHSQKRYRNHLFFLNSLKDFSHQDKKKRSQSEDENEINNRKRNSNATFIHGEQIKSLDKSGKYNLNNHQNVLYGKNHESINTVMNHCTNFIQLTEHENNKIINTTYKPETKTKKLPIDNWRFFEYDRINPHIKGNKERRQRAPKGKENYAKLSKNKEDNDIYFSPCHINNMSSEDINLNDTYQKESQATSLSTITVDTVPVSPDFPRVPGSPCRQEGVIMMHYLPCNGYTCRHKQKTMKMEIQV